MLGVLFAANVLLAPAARLGAQGVPASGGGSGVVPTVTTATPGLPPADMTATAIAGSLPLTGSAAATATAQALAGGNAPGSGTIPVTGHPDDTPLYLLLGVLLAVALVAVGFWLRRERARRIQ
jgi:LPXTG-motif cell wall-anchored protein